MAVLETSELPGSESTIDCARLLGSSEGTFEANRAKVKETDAAGRVRGIIAGRSRPAPGIPGQQKILSTYNIGGLLIAVRRTLDAMMGRLYHNGFAESARPEVGTRSSSTSLGALNCGKEI